MLLGDTLQFFREGLNLTQKEFISNLITTSYYSKVERNESDLTTDKLMKLLNQNNISISEFYFKLNDGQEETFILLFKKIRLAYYENNVESLKEIQSTMLNDEPYYVIINLLKDDIQLVNLNIKDIEKINNYLIDVNQWKESDILLFILATKILPVDKLLFMIKLFFKSITESNVPKIYEKDFLLALFNIIYVCLKEGRIDEAEYLLILPDKVMTLPYSLFEKMLLKFYKQFILYKKEINNPIYLNECKKIVAIFKEYDLSILVRDLSFLYEK